MSVSDVGILRSCQKLIDSEPSVMEPYMIMARIYGKYEIQSIQNKAINRTTSKRFNIDNWCRKLICHFAAYFVFSLFFLLGNHGDIRCFEVLESAEKRFPGDFTIQFLRASLTQQVTNKKIQQQKTKENAINNLLICFAFTISMFVR